MAWVPIDIPPGVVRTATPYGAKGRWYDMQLARWIGPKERPTLLPVGSWAEHTTTGLPSAAVRGAHGWTTDNSTGLAALGYVSGEVWLLALLSGTGTDITPVDYVTPSDSWSFDNYGQDLVAAAPGGDAVLYRSTQGGGVLTAITDSPAADAVVVTPERFVVALGGVTSRTVHWSDQEDHTNWDISDVDAQTGDFRLQARGKILAGRRSRDETLIWTSNDFWGMRYIGGDHVYSFHRLGDYCGPISRRAMQVMDTTSVWMGRGKFFVYDGFVRELECPLKDFIFTRDQNANSPGLNRSHGWKVSSVVNEEFSEVWWFYPSLQSTENDRYVVYNYRLGEWGFGSIARSDAVPGDVHEGLGPLWFSNSGVAYKHEQADTEGWQDTGGSAQTPYATSGPIELGEGDHAMMARGYLPDEDTLGEADISLKHADYPMGTETTTALGTLTAKTDFRITARQMRVHVVASALGRGFRFGRPRLDLVKGATR